MYGVCKFWLRGDCKSGYRCNFLHETICQYGQSCNDRNCRKRHKPPNRYGHPRYGRSPERYWSRDRRSRSRSYSRGRRSSRSRSRSYSRERRSRSYSRGRSRSRSYDRMRHRSRSYSRDRNRRSRSHSRSSQKSVRRSHSKERELQPSPKESENEAKPTNKENSLFKIIESPDSTGKEQENHNNVTEKDEQKIESYWNMDIFPSEIPNLDIKERIRSKWSESPRKSEERNVDQSIFGANDLMDGIFATDEQKPLLPKQASPDLSDIFLSPKRKDVKSELSPAEQNLLLKDKLSALLETKSCDIYQDLSPKSHASTPEKEKEPSPVLAENVDSIFEKLPMLKEIIKTLDKKKKSKKDKKPKKKKKRRSFSSSSSSSSDSESEKKKKKKKSDKEEHEKLSTKQIIDLKEKKMSISMKMRSLIEQRTALISQKDKILREHSIDPIKAEALLQENISLVKAIADQIQRMHAMIEEIDDRLEGNPDKEETSKKKKKEKESEKEVKKDKEDKKSKEKSKDRESEKDKDHEREREREKEREREREKDREREREKDREREREKDREREREKDREREREKDREREREKDQEREREKERERERDKERERERERDRVKEYERERDQERELKGFSSTFKPPKEYDYYDEQEMMDDENYSKRKRDHDCSPKEKHDRLSKHKRVEDSDSEEEKPQIKDFNKVCEDIKFVDGGNHWCRSCFSFSETFIDYINHLTTPEHMEKLQIVKKDWFDCSATRLKPLFKPKASSTAPLQGVEFIKTVKVYYCALCEMHLKKKEDLLCHTETEIHVQKYKEFQMKNPLFEASYNKEKMSAFAKYSISKAKKSMESSQSTLSRKKLETNEPEKKFKEYSPKHRYRSKSPVSDRKRNGNHSKGDKYSTRSPSPENSLKSKKDKLKHLRDMITTDSETKDREINSSSYKKDTELIANTSESKGKLDMYNILLSKKNANRIKEQEQQIAKTKEKKLDSSKVKTQDETEIMNLAKSEKEPLKTNEKSESAPTKITSNTLSVENRLKEKLAMKMLQKRLEKKKKSSIESKKDKVAPPPTTEEIREFTQEYLEQTRQESPSSSDSEPEAENAVKGTAKTLLELQKKLSKSSPATSQISKSAVISAKPKLTTDKPKIDASTLNNAKSTLANTTVSTQPSEFAYTQENVNSMYNYNSYPTYTNTYQPPDASQFYDSYQSYGNNYYSMPLMTQQNVPQNKTIPNASDTKVTENKEKSGSWDSLFDNNMDQIDINLQNTPPPPGTEDDFLKNHSDDEVNGQDKSDKNIANPEALLDSLLGTHSNDEEKENATGVSNETIKAPPETLLDSILGKDSNDEAPLPLKQTNDVLDSILESTNNETENDTEKNDGEDTPISSLIEAAINNSAKEEDENDKDDEGDTSISSLLEAKIADAVKEKTEISTPVLRRSSRRTTKSS